MQWLGVFVLGGLGAVSRVALAGLFPARALPWGTLLVNLVGCALIGVAFQAFETRTHWPLALRISWVGGFLGGFTTFSAFGLESYELLQEGAWPAALAYVAASVLGGLGAVVLGISLARQIT